MVTRRVRALVKPELLRWARTSAGFDVATAAAKAHLDPSRLEEWEREHAENAPSIPQLRELARIYRRPLAIFYLPAPPRTFDALHDFRRLPDAASHASPDLLHQIRLAHLRRDAALEMYRLLDEIPPPFTATLTRGADPERAGARVRELLEVPVRQQLAWQDDYAAFNAWRAAAERVGTLVFQMRDVEVREARGFSISARPLPAVVVNVKDAPRPRIFSLFHELAHVLINNGGVCDLTDQAGGGADAQVEVFCNAVAAAALLPADTLLAQDVVRGVRRDAWSDDAIAVLARRFKVSREAIVRRLTTVGLASEPFYRARRDQYLREGAAAAREGWFAPPHRMALTTAGPAFTRLVLEAYGRERITASDVADYLQVRLKHLSAIADDLAALPRAV